jgi:carboxypeptidase family protein
MSFGFDTFVRELRHGALAAALFVAMIAPGSLDAQGTGIITGTVATASRPHAPLRVTFDQKVCGNELPDDAVVRGPSGALANAVITLAGVKAKGPGAPPTILNEKCRFVPRVQVARPQASVTTTSTDPVLHTTNAQREDGRLLFNIALPVPGMKISKPAGDAGVVRVSCNTHPWMHGWLVVTDDMAAVTAADGKFTLRDVPAGTYELRVWHEALKGAPRKVTIGAGQTVVADFSLQ